jgi:hypothetical protein
MARMRRIQIVIDPQLDDWLRHEAATKGVSKSSLVRACVRERAGLPFDNGLWQLPTYDAGEADDSVNHDVLIYGLDRH